MSKKKEQHDEHVDESWLIPYADLLTLLLALFIVLFASSQVDQQKFSAMREAFGGIFMSSGSGVIGNYDRIGFPDGLSAGSDATQGSDQPENKTSATDAADIPVNEKINKLRSSFDQYIDGHRLQDKLHTELGNQTVMIVISDVVLFNSGSAAIKPEFYDTIGAIGNILAENPGLEVQILGHTDNIPIVGSRFETNWDLSTQRALAFMKILLADKRLDPARYSAIGYGEYRPVADNGTEVGRATNRRVEVTAKYNS